MARSHPWHQGLARELHDPIGGPRRDRRIVSYLRDPARLDHDRDAIANRATAIEESTAAQDGPDGGFHSFLQRLDPTERAV